MDVMEMDIVYQKIVTVCDSCNKNAVQSRMETTKTIAPTCNNNFGIILFLRDSQPCKSRFWYCLPLQVLYSTLKKNLSRQSTTPATGQGTCHCRISLHQNESSDLNQLLVHPQSWWPPFDKGHVIVWVFGDTQELPNKVLLLLCCVSIEEFVCGSWWIIL